MNLIHRLELWGDRHHPKWLDLIRIALGVFLIYKGIDFFRNMSVLMSMMEKTPFSSFMFIFVGHVVPFIHMVGGFLLVLGLFTRFACLIQIPILLGAVIFVNTSRDMLQPYSEMLLSVIVLLLLVYFLIIGNGPLSVRIPAEEPKKVH
ncbi:MAG: DoxX family protein [Ferruginibacter sp.]